MRRKVARLGLNQLHFALQAEVAGDARSDATHGVREHGGANAIDITSERHATEFGAGFNEDRLHAGAGEVGGGNEAVMSTTDHHHVGGGGGLCGARRLLHFRW